MMRKKMYNKIGSVRLAPNRERLAVFGGDLSIEEFRSDNLVDTEIPNPIQTDDFEDRVVPVTSSNVVKMEEIKSADGKNETLRLKREKPLKRNQNNLESALGLIIKTKP